MRGVFTATYQIASVTTAKTLLYITAPSSAVVEILSAKVTQSGVTTPEQLECGLAKIASLGTPTATTLTPKVSETGSSAAGSTVKGNVTASEPTYETDGGALAVFVDRQAWNNLGGYFFDPLPEERPHIAPGATFGLKLLAAPTNTYTIDVQITFREIG